MRLAYEVSSTNLVLLGWLAYFSRSMQPKYVWFLLPDLSGGEAAREGQHYEVSQDQEPNLTTSYLGLAVHIKNKIDRENRT